MTPRQIKITSPDLYNFVRPDLARTINDINENRFNPWLISAFTNIVNADKLPVTNPDTDDLHIFVIPQCPIHTNLHLYQQVDIVCKAILAWVKERHNQKNFVIVANDMSECFEQEKWKLFLVVDNLIKRLEHNIHLVYVTAAIPTDINQNEMHELGFWSDYVGLRDILYHPNWSQSTINQQSKLEPQIDGPTVGDKPYKILCYNNGVKSHRAVMAGKLLQLGDKLPSTLSWCQPQSNYGKEIHNRFPDQINMLIDTVTEPLLLNDWNYTNATFATIDSIHAETCHVGLVTETVFFTKHNLKSDEPSLFGRFCTEKTWKFINGYMPFILVTRPHTLKALRDLGFKTFSYWWDESYDDVIDDMERLDALIKLLDDLSDWTDTDWTSFSKKVVPTVLHNNKRLHAYTKELYFNGEITCRM